MAEIASSHSEQVPSDAPTPNDMSDSSSVSSVDGQEDEESSLPEGLAEEPQERNEVEQVEKMAQKDTQRVRLGRLAMMAVLTLSAVTVTASTYKFLLREQRRAYGSAFELFARAIKNAALEQQRQIREGMQSFTSALGAAAQSSSESTTTSTWPYYSMPLFESYAQSARIQTGAEFIAQYNLVKQEQRYNYTRWVSRHYQEDVAEGHLIAWDHPPDLDPTSYKPFIYVNTPEGPIPDVEREYYFPNYGFSPPPSSYGYVNWNLASIDDYAEVLEAVLALKNETLITRVRPYSQAISFAFTPEEHAAMHSERKDSTMEHPHSFVVHPIHKDITDYNSEIVGIAGGGIAWDAALRNLLPAGVEGILAVIKNNANQIFTYEIVGEDAIFEGQGDLHDKAFGEYEVVVDLALHSHPKFTTTPGHCQFSLHIYPSAKFANAYDRWTPEIFATVVAFSFLVMTVVFCQYDVFVRRRNDKIVATAATSNGIVASMFPDQFRERLIAENALANQKEWKNKEAGTLDSFILVNGGGDHEKKPVNGVSSAAAPLADLFLETSILFCDIAGFTAWSSVREPSQVFTLLETLYSSYDEVARRRRIYKVETVGDCYVAVAGMPDPRPDHVVAIARFAAEIIRKTVEVVKQLESSLGPETGDLQVRVGIHSGPVTGGVLRGDRSRFQLFGDTMNTASRMESTSLPGRIQVSKQSADLLMKAGKDAWLQPRDEQVHAKGKGILQTYWLHLKTRAGSSARSSSVSVSDTELDSNRHSAQPYRGLDEETSRLVDWNVVVLHRLLRQIAARREAATPKAKHTGTVTEVALKSNSKGTPLDEIEEIIVLPKFDAKVIGKQKDWNGIFLPDGVMGQLTDYVTCIANLYHDNPFHSFSHCCHVVMSVVKLMSRIVAPTSKLEASTTTTSHEAKPTAMALHDHTYGITSDPLTQFACVFSALIHDVDHTGVPNAQLIKENPTMASIYKERSVAEQNSLDIAWELLMDERFKDLRAAIYSTPEELNRFRQLVVNSVMATDIADKDLKKLRNARWEKAFRSKQEDANLTAEGEQSSDASSKKTGSSSSSVHKSPTGKDSRAMVNRKATIVIEHLIQASDVSHTMQHWHIYRKWNEKLFRELYKAYMEGRANKDPSEFWYEGEMGFFDFYIIPLAKKLKDCGVFGKSSDEYLIYALSNRHEWEQRGKEITAEMKEKCKQSFSTMLSSFSSSLETNRSKWV